MTKVAIVGAGRIGKRHIDVYHRLSSKYPLSIFYSNTSPEKVEDVKAYMAQKYMKFIAEGFSNWKEMLSRIRPDIVDICSPEYNHLENLQHVIENRSNYNFKTLNCQKPLFLPEHIAEGEKLVDKIKSLTIKSGTTLQIKSVPKQLENVRINGQTYNEIKKTGKFNVSWFTYNPKQEANPKTDLIPHVLCIYDDEIKSIKKIYEESRQAIFMVNGQHRIAVGFAFNKEQAKRKWEIGNHSFEYKIEGEGIAHIYCFVDRKFVRKVKLQDPLEVYLESVLKGAPLADAEFGLRNAKTTAQLNAV